MHMVTGAAWCTKKLKEIGRATSELCELCGEPDVDWKHKCWECKLVLKAMQKNKIDGLNFEDMPESLLHGIPPAMTQHVDRTFWGLMHHELKAKSRTQIEQMGIRPMGTKRMIMESKECDLQKHYKEKNKKETRSETFCE